MGEYEHHLWERFPELMRRVHSKDTIRVTVKRPVDEKASRLEGSVEGIECRYLLVHNPLTGTTNVPLGWMEKYEFLTPPRFDSTNETKAYNERAKRTTSLYVF